MYTITPYLDPWKPQQQTNPVGCNKEVAMVLLHLTRVRNTKGFYFCFTFSTLLNVRANSAHSETVMGREAAKKKQLPLEFPRGISYKNCGLGKFQDH